MHFDRDSAIKTMYYLIAVDGIVSEEETTKINEIAMELDPDNLAGRIDEIVEECNSRIQDISDDELYEIIQESVDKAIMESSEEYSLFVPSRMVIWDMLALAYSDLEYRNEERKLIKHVCRFVDIDISVFSEMESIIKTLKAVDEELEWLNKSDKPYHEIRPIVDEIEKRKDTLRISAQSLIEDEVLFLERHVEKEPTKFEQTRDAFIDKSKEITSVVGEKGKEVATIAGEKGKEAAIAVGKTGAKLFAKVVKKVRKEDK